MLTDAHTLGLQPLGSHFLDEFDLNPQQKLTESDIHQILGIGIQRFANNRPDKA